MKLQKQIDQMTTQRASQWVEVLKNGTAADRAAFAEWLSESRKHVAEFLTMAVLDHELRALKLKGRHDIELRLKSLGPRVAEFTSGHALPAREPRRRLQWQWVSGLAAAILVAAVAVAYFRGMFWQTFETAVGEQRTLELEDGSLVDVNALSRVEVRLNDAAREIRLVRGEAMFKVARDPARPFRVHTRDAVVEAVGTQFNVYARETGTLVSVLEGRVNVHAAAVPEDADAIPQAGSPSDTLPSGSAALEAGQALEVGPAGQLKREPRAEIARARAWRDRLLVFERAPLEEVVREFNRYNSSIRLRLEGVEPGSRHYTGTFEADDPKAFGDFLSRERDLEVIMDERQILIRHRESATRPEGHTEEN
jgi:transmembrane sensor